MKKNKKRLFNWHFWIPKLKMQIVVEDTNYQRAANRARLLLNRPIFNSKIQFQFGELV